MKKDIGLTREEIEDILDRIHIQEYEWYIDDKEDEHFCSSSEEDAELVEKAIKGLINQYNNDYISKDKIRDKIKLLKKSRTWYLNGEKILFSTFDMINSKIELLKDLLKE